MRGSETVRSGPVPAEAGASVVERVADGARAVACVAPRRAA
jgi:hypothetical protein